MQHKYRGDHYHKENNTNGGKQIEFRAESNQFEKKSKVATNEMFSNCLSATLRVQIVSFNYVMLIPSMCHNPCERGLSTLSNLGELIHSQTRGGGEGIRPSRSLAFLDPNYTKFGVMIVPYKKKIN